MSVNLPDGEHDLVWWLRFGRMHEAADEIERLRARVAQLEAQHAALWDHVDHARMIDPDGAA